MTLVQFFQVAGVAIGAIATLIGLMTWYRVKCWHEHPKSDEIAQWVTSSFAQDQLTNGSGQWRLGYNSVNGEGIKPVWSKGEVRVAIGFIWCYYNGQYRFNRADSLQIKAAIKDWNRRRNLSIDAANLDAARAIDTRQQVRPEPPPAPPPKVVAMADRCVRCGAPYANTGQCSNYFNGCQGGRGENPAASPEDVNGSADSTDRVFRTS